MARKIPGRALDPTTSIAISNISFGSNVTVNTSTILLGNSTVNTVINSTSVATKSLVANGTIGSDGQLLASNGTALYWTNPPASTNTNAQYIWTNNHIFQAAFTIANTLTIGNSTVNSVINSTAIVTGDLVINATANVGANLSANNVTIRGNIQVDGNLTVTGTSVTLTSVNLKLADNLIYLNEPSNTTITGASSNGTHFLYNAINGYTVGMSVTVASIDPPGYNVTDATITLANSTNFAVANTTSPGSYVSGGVAAARSAAMPDLGFTGEYNDGTRKHTGFFRDATDNIWKVFDSYTPDPNGAFIDTSNVTFRIADFTANVITANSFSGNGSSITSVNAATVGGNTATTLLAASETKAGEAYSNAVAYAASNTYVNSTFLPLAGGTLTGALIGRINPRVSSTTSTSSITPDISAFDQYCVTAQAATLTINAPIGTPVDGNRLLFRILDNGTPQTVNWNATFTSMGAVLPTLTTANKMIYVGCIYNAANTRWDVIAVTQQA